MTNNAWNQTINLRFRDPDSIYAMLKKFRPQFHLPAGTNPKNWFASQIDPDTQQYLSTNLTATANGFELQQRLAMSLDPDELKKTQDVFGVPPRSFGIKADEIASKAVQAYSIWGQGVSAEFDFVVQTHNKLEAGNVERAYDLVLWEDYQAASGLKRVKVDKFLFALIPKISNRYAVFGVQNYQDLSVQVKAKILM